MKIAAVGVIATNMKRTAEFYTQLGFDFSKANLNDDHVEPITPPGSARLMIDTKELVTGIIGEEPNPGNHSSFAINYDSPEEVNKVVEKIRAKGYKIVKDPWDAFWDQRYAIVEDPDGYKIDLYAELP